MLCKIVPKVQFLPNVILSDSEESVVRKPVQDRCSAPDPSLRQTAPFRMTTDREQGYFVLCCISINYKKLMFAVPMPVRGIEPSEATKLKTHTFPVIQRFVIWRKYHIFEQYANPSDFEI